MSRSVGARLARLEQAAGDGSAAFWVATPEEWEAAIREGWRRVDAHRQARGLPPVGEPARRRFEDMLQAVGEARR
jgi:hypothetical protein